MGCLTSEKLAQAEALVAGSDLDVWMIFVRETSGGSDPILPLLLEGGLTWESALLIGRKGQRIAVAGSFDADPLRASGDWPEVVSYVEGIRGPLLEVLERLLPEPPSGSAPRIGVDFSPSDPAADGLTHGLFLALESYLRGTRFEGSLVSAEGVVSELRSRKTREEVRRMRLAISETEALFQETAEHIHPGITEREIYDFIQQRVEERGLGFSWDRHGDPIVNTGPDSMVGHGVPSTGISVAPGHIVHVDLGVLRDGYASDLQRCWYLPESGSGLPPEVARALEAVNGAISAGAGALRPGVQGWEVDAAARSYLVEAGYPEYLHALGHQVGRLAHDGGGILGPRWERYGRTPYIPVCKDQVYTLEPGVMVEGRGYLGIEEMVVVTGDGCEWLSSRQLEMPSLGS